MCSLPSCTHSPPSYTHSPPLAYIYPPLALIPPSCMCSPPLTHIPLLLHALPPPARVHPPLTHVRPLLHVFTPLSHTFTPSCTCSPPSCPHSPLSCTCAPPRAHIHLVLSKCLLCARHPMGYYKQEEEEEKTKLTRTWAITSRPHLHCLREIFLFKLVGLRGALERILCAAKRFMNEAASLGLRCCCLPISAWPPPLGSLLGNCRKSTCATKEVRALLGWTLLSWRHPVGIKMMSQLYVLHKIRWGRGIDVCVR